MRSIGFRGVDCHSIYDPAIEALWTTKIRAEVAASVLNRDPGIRFVLGISETEYRRPFLFRQGGEDRESSLDSRLVNGC